MNQMMLAIYEANPQAFAGNINYLKEGSILRIPADQELTDRGRREAFSEVQRQNDEWRGAAPETASQQRLRLVPPEDEPDPATSPEAPAARPEEVPAASSIADTAASDRLRERVAELEGELEDSRRMLEVRDSELQALQQRLAELEGRDVRVEDIEPAAEAPVDDVADEAPVEDPAAIADEEPAAAPDIEEPVAETPADATRTVVTAQDESSFLDTIMGIVFSLWFWLTAAVVLVIGLFVRNRMATQEAVEYVAGPDEPTASPDTFAGAVSEPAGDILVEETSETEILKFTPPGMEDEEAEAEEEPEAETIAAAEAEEGPVAVDEETPYEQTLSSDTALDLDQDPVAEADFHMAYGLYDQAADLLNRALQAQPGRQELRTKLLEVYFVWENKEGFLEQARQLKEAIGDDAAGAWKNVLIMGQQLCPDDELFAGADLAAAGDADMDLEFASESESDLDMEFTGDDAAAPVEEAAADEDLLDFQLDETLLEDDGESTQETPTIETPGPEVTQETPTIETPAVSDTAELPAMDADGDVPSGDRTAEIELDDLGLDLTSLEGEAEFSADDAGELDDLAFDEAGEDEEEPEDAPEAVAEEPDEEPETGDTAEMPQVAADQDETEVLAAGDIEDEATVLASAVEDDDETVLASGVDEGDTLVASAVDEDTIIADSADEVPAATVQLPEISPDDTGFNLADVASAMAGADEDSGEVPVLDGDTVEQPGPDVEDDELSLEGDTSREAVLQGDTAREPVLEGDTLLQEALEGDTEVQEALVETEAGEEVASEEPTMTEVGTKLDLARAYVDMGDPDGARSILTEVLDEGDDSQRQEARQLLDGLADAD